MLFQLIALSCVTASAQVSTNLAVTQVGTSCTQNGLYQCGGPKNAAGQDSINICSGGTWVKVKQQQKKRKKKRKKETETMHVTLHYLVNYKIIFALLYSSPLYYFSLKLIFYIHVFMILLG